MELSEIIPPAEKSKGSDNMVAIAEHLERASSRAKSYQLNGGESRLEEEGQEKKNKEGEEREEREASTSSSASTSTSTTLSASPGSKLPERRMSARRSTRNATSPPGDRTRNVTLTPLETQAKARRDEEEEEEEVDEKEKDVHTGGNIGRNGVRKKIKLRSDEAGKTSKTNEEDAGMSMSMSMSMNEPPPSQETRKGSRGRARRGDGQRQLVSHSSPKENGNSSSNAPAEASSPSVSSTTALQRKSGTLTLLRHGMSIFNRDPRNPDIVWRYAGSLDAPLNSQGVQEAVEAGERMRNHKIDCTFTSTLNRATVTAFLALNKLSDPRPVVYYRNADEEEETEEKVVVDNKQMRRKRPTKQTPFKPGNGPEDEEDAMLNGNPVYTAPSPTPRLREIVEQTIASVDEALPVFCSSLLNERNFGDFQGIPSTDHFKNHSKEEVKKFRNDFHTPFPNGESSEDVFNRVIPFFEADVVPLLNAGKNVCIVGHGFVVRVLLKHLLKMTAEEWDMHMQIEKSNPEKCVLLAPTGVPLTFSWDPETQQVEKIMEDKEYELAQTSAAY